jgi:D-aspartate ligase
MPAILLGGHMNALSAARSLWKMGVAVDVFDDASSDVHIRRSRACRRHFTLDTNRDVAEQWMSWLLKDCEPSVVIPCSDDGLELIARHRRELESAGHRPTEANDEVVLALLDKSTTYDLARRAGIPSPRTITLTTRADFAMLDDFLFPCAIKPVRSHDFSRRFRPLAKGSFVQSRSEAMQISGPIVDENMPMLLTEVVEGTDECCSYFSYLDADGAPLTHFTKRKLRQYPTRFGLGTYHLTKWDADVAQLGLRFFQAIGLRGIGNVEFKRDVRDGVLKLIESNPRLINANEVVRVAGIDFVRLAYTRVAGLPPPPLDSFKDDIGLWFPIDDIRALRCYQRDGELSISAWARSLMRKQCAPQFNLADPLPSVFSATQRLGRLTRRASPGSVSGRRPDADPYSASSPA